MPVGVLPVVCGHRILCQIARCVCHIATKTADTSAMQLRAVPIVADEAFAAWDAECAAVCAAGCAAVVTAVVAVVSAGMESVGIESVAVAVSMISRLYSMI